MKRLRVLHLNTERGFRGGEAQTLLLAAGLRARGHECLIAGAAGAPLAERAQAAGVAVWTRQVRGELDLPAIAALAREIGRFRPDLMHFHTSHAVTLGTAAGLIASPLRRIPAVLTRRVSFSLARNPLARLKYRFRIDHLIAVAEGVRWVLIREGIEPERITVIHSGIDLARFAGEERVARARALRRELQIPESAYVIGAAGALVAHKGLGTLVDAFGVLARERPDARLLLAGEGPERGPLTERARAAGCADSVVFAGWRDDIPAVMSALDLLVLPSVSGEGSPAVVKEAMACGVPVVAADLDGVREIVEDGVEALLVKPGSAEAIAGAVRAVSTDAALRERLVTRGRTRVADFSAERMVERTLEVYERVLGPRRGAA